MTWQLGLLSSDLTFDVSSWYDVVVEMVIENTYVLDKC